MVKNCEKIAKPRKGFRNDERKENEAKENLLDRMESYKNVETHIAGERDSDSFDGDQTLSQSPFKRRKLVAIEYTPNSDDSKAECFKHVRSSIDMVRPEIYSSVDLLTVGTTVLKSKQ